MTVRFKITRETEDESKDIWVECEVNQMGCDKFATDDDGKRYELNDLEKDRAYDTWDRALD